MDIPNIFFSFLATYWYLLPIVILISLVKTPWFKGVMGEVFVNVAAKVQLDKNLYHLIPDITLPTNGGTTQIDHVIVSKFGVFVIETKNMAGWIFGSQHQKTWIQKIYKSSTKFQNPLHQNYKHTKTLESLLGLNDQQIHSVITFVGGSTFKTEMPENVTYGAEYISYIKSKQKEVLTQEQVQKIKALIESNSLAKTFKTNIQHARHVKEVVASKEQLAKEQVCPKCGSLMVKRKARKGKYAGNEFYGCSTYPKCRGTIKDSSQ